MAGERRYKMSTNEIITLITNSVIVPLLIWGISELVNYLKEKSQSAKFDYIIELAGGAVKDAVVAANQTYINELKKDGKFDKKEQEKAFNSVKFEVKKTLGYGGVVLLKQAVGDLEAFLNNKIEKEVALNK